MRRIQTLFFGLVFMKPMIHQGISRLYGLNHDKFSVRQTNGFPGHHLIRVNTRSLICYNVTEYIPLESEKVLCHNSKTNKEKISFEYNPLDLLSSNIISSPFLLKYPLFIDF